jgi:hypothetical protein
VREIRVIGITGRARSGKDTVADMIKDHIGGTRYSFAKPMYDMMTALGMDFKSPDWDGQKEKPIPGVGKSPRQLLQTLGTEWGRNCVNPDFWIFFAKMQLDYASKLIVSDVRFDNEADWVREEGVLLRVVRANTEEVNPHVSEAGVTPRESDVLIRNDGTLEDLRRLVNSVMDHVIDT